MKPRSLIVNYNGPVSYTKTQVLKAGRLLFQLVGNSLKTVAGLFIKPKPIEGQTLNQIQPRKRRRPSFSRSSYLILKNRISNQQTLQPPKQKDQYIELSPPDLSKNDGKRIADASTQVYTIQSTLSPNLINCLFLSPNVHIQVDEQLESQVEFEYTQCKSGKTKSSAKEQEFDRFQNGSKKIKTQSSYQIEPTVQEQKTNLTLTETDYLSKDYPQMIVNIINKRDRERKEHAQQIRTNYEKTMNKPKKKQIVREIKQARKLMREVRSRQQDVKIRFDLYRIQRKKKIKSSLKIQKVNQLNLEIKGPSPIITIVQQQAPVSRVIRKVKISPPKNILQEQITTHKVIVQQESVPKKVAREQLPIPEITIKEIVPDKVKHKQKQAQAQQTRSKKKVTFKLPDWPKEEKKVQVKIIQKKEEKPIQLVKPLIYNNPFKISKPTELDEAVITSGKQAQNQLFKNFTSQRIKEKTSESIQNTEKKEQKINIYKPVQQITQKPLVQVPKKQIKVQIQNIPKQQTAQPVQLVNRPLEKLKNIFRKQTKPTEAKQISKPQLQIPSQPKQVQQISANKIPIVQILKQPEIKAPIVEIPHNQTVFQHKQQNSSPKVNPFLSSTPSAKLTINDILTKNPQFAIFQKTESAPQVSPPLTSQSQNVASIFMSNDSTVNPFIFNHPQAEEQHSYAFSNNNPFAFVSNSSNYEQQIHIHNNDNNNYQNFQFYQSYQQNMEQQHHQQEYNHHQQQQHYNNHYQQDYNNQQHNYNNQQKQNYNNNNQQQQQQQQQDYNNQNYNMSQDYNINQYYNTNNMNQNYSMSQDQSYMMNQNQGYSMDQNQGYSMDQSQGYSINQGQNYSMNHNQNYSMNQDQHNSMNQGYNSNQDYNMGQNYYNLNQDYSTNQYQQDNQNNQIQVSYQPGTFADPIFSRTLFEAVPQAVQHVPGSLFQSMISTNNYNNRNNTRTSGSGRNKKPKDIRI